MMELKKILEGKIGEHKETLQKIRKEHGDKIIGEVTVDHLFQGVRGLPVTYTPTSHVDPNLGVMYRGKSLKEVNNLLPKLPDTDIVSCESVFWFLLTGEVPTQSQVETLRKDIHMHSNVPYHVFNVIDALPSNARPMTRFCTGIVSWTTSSIFQDLYDRGKISKGDFWKYSFDDSIQIISGISQIAAYIYRVHCKKLDPIDPDSDLDWTGNFSHMMGYDDKSTKDLLRLFVFTHIDHSASNVSAHTAHTVGSALANAYYTGTASMLGLAGPLHGHANEQTISWLLNLLNVAKENGLEEPDKNLILNYINKTLDSGKVIPGYGHAALRVEDPRFTLFYERCKKDGFNTPILRLVDNIYKVLPGILQSLGKVSNPHPNIDAISGSCLYSEGIVEKNFYTVLFGLSRLIGLLTQHILDRSIGQPIFRPRTMSLDMLLKEYALNESKK